MFTDPNVTAGIEFERMYVRFKPRFVVIARSYVRDEAVAEDIVTDCFVSFWERRSVLPENTEPLPYIMTSVRNRCLNYLKEQQRHLKVHGELYDTQKRMVAAHIRTLESHDPVDLFSVEVAAIVERQLAQMPELSRTVLVEIRFMGRSYADVAAELGITTRRAEHELAKATSVMRRALGDYMMMIPMLATLWG